MKKEDIVLLSTADWNNPFWTNKQHVAVQLAKRGHRVFYINSLGLRRPSVSSQDLNRIAQRLKQGFRAPEKVQNNIWVWSPVLLPFQGNVYIRKLNNFIFNSLLNYWLGKLGFHKDILWTYNPLTVHLMNFSNFSKIVYHCVDEIKAQPGMPSELLETAEKLLVERSDLVFVTASKLFETRKKWNDQTYYFANVADYDHFSAAMDESTIIPADLQNIPSPRIGFIGAISGYKIDFALLRYVAQARPNYSIVLIGKVGEGDPWTDADLLSEIPNVYLLGSRSYKDLPNHLKGFDVAILPNRLNEYTECMFPMKFFEYLAAGKNVVSVNLPALKEFDDIAFLTDTPEAFVLGIDRILAGQGPALEARLAIAKKYTYEARTDAMLELVSKINI